MHIEIPNAEEICVLRDTTNGRDAVHIQVVKRQADGLFAVTTYWGRSGTQPQMRTTLKDATRGEAGQKVSEVMDTKLNKGYQRERVADFVTVTGSKPTPVASSPIESVRPAWGPQHGGGGLF